MSIETFLRYVENGSLCDMLMPESVGTWEDPRFGFAYGVAKCFKYLHHELREVVIHRDLKPANVLVDGSMQPKVAPVFPKRTLVLSYNIATVSTRP